VVGVPPPRHRHRSGGYYDSYYGRGH
jgi:hypothetical protein